MSYIEYNAIDRNGRVNMMLQDVSKYVSESRLQPGDIRRHRLWKAILLKKDVAAYDFDFTPKNAQNQKNAFTTDSTLLANDAFAITSSCVGVKKVYFNDVNGLDEFIANSVMQFYADPNIFKGKPVVAPAAGTFEPDEAQCLESIWEGGTFNFMIENASVITDLDMRDFRHVPMAQTNNAQQNMSIGDEWRSAGCGKWLHGGNTNKITVTLGEGKKDKIEGNYKSTGAAGAAFVSPLLGYNNIKNFNLLIVGLEGLIIKGGSKSVTASSMARM